MLRYVNSGVMTIKLRHQTNRNVSIIWSDKSSFTLFPTSGRIYVWSSTQGSLKSGILFSSSETWRRFCDGSGSNIMVFYWSHYPSWPNYCKGLHGQVG
jgi:hypothetical protein